ncbi:glycosyltransferase [Pseudalkalibacillus sp. Hm43]|uniref:glycosyltransferase n=1 Tax=Pseudalkalibacillus sp. Hm43 TaxID=3450742 RepID=UPI003F426255
MNILFIGVACTKNAILESNKKYYNFDQVRPQQYFDMTLISGLSNNASVTAVSLPPVASFPTSSCLYYRRKKEKINKNLLINYISLINLPFIKTIIIMMYIFFFTLKFCVMTRKEDRVILLGNLTSYISFPAMVISKITKTKIFAVVPDVPKFAASYTRITNSAKRIINKALGVLDKYIEHRFDGYILLTEAMNDLVNKKRKPYIVIEGMIRKKDFEVFSNKGIKKYPSKVMMYAGTLHAKFGIKNLVESFDSIDPSFNAELWIYGKGDFENELDYFIKKNPNIRYKGSQPRSEIIEKEHIATILVNPRPASEKFTKYSFPSKTLEYMASGTPLITTKLSGIPKEYYKFVFTFRNEDIEDMTRDLENILSLPTETLKNFGNKAKKFVLEKKNHEIQTKKIYDFLKKSNDL